jgi:hypothetical protein
VFDLSSLFNDAIYKIFRVLCEVTTGEKGVGSVRRRREREQQINGVRE